MRRILPITPHEFAAQLERCVPPGGWPSAFAVANSGGPDSTCLLHLLRRALSNKSNVDSIPSQHRDVCSISVDHGLQPTSASMSIHAACNAKALGARHITMSIPWSQSPFPPLPKSGSVETIARQARYHVLLEAMRANGLHVLAVGHHADDQLETTLMRLERNGRAELENLAGMRRVRRWGMGSEGGPGALGFAGQHGMDRWIIRPLLDIGKDRILATCEANGLEYVTDKTNFQPDLTPRNALRKVLSQANLDETFGNGRAGHVIPGKLPNAFRDMKTQLLSGYTSQTRDLLHTASQRSEALEENVTEYVLGARRPSPASTLLLSFARRPPECLRERVVLRVLRYVSPQPWGSPAAEAGRSSESLQRIAEAFWGKIGKDQPKTKKSSILRFTAGGHVLWSKVVILPNGRPVSRKPYTKGEDVGWLATRLPPSAQEGNSSLNVDITHRLRDAAENNQSQVQILWDCRFLIEFDVREMLGAIAPKGDMRMHIVPQERWFSPALRVFGEGIDQTKSLVGDEPIPKWARVTFIRELGSL